MASTPTPGLRLELIADGEASNTWGLKTNTNLAMLDRALAGYIVYPIVAGTNTLSTTDYQLGDWHNMAWKLTGALEGDAAFVVPALEKVYIIENAATGNYALTVRPAGGTGIAIPQGQRAIVLCDGTNITGTVLQPYTANGASIGAINAPGFLARKADGTWAAREIKGTDEQIIVTQGFGDTGPAVLSLNTNLVAPGTLKVKTGFTVDAGGARVSAGGLFVDAGGARFGGQNTNVAIASTVGFGSMDISGPSGGLIDLKNSESEDFDVRLFTTGNGGGITALGSFEVAVTANSIAAFKVANKVIGAFTDGGLGVYTGLIDQGIDVVGDSAIQWRNPVRTWSAGVRSSGGWSLRNNGADAFSVDATNVASFVNGITITGNQLAVLNGGIFAANGPVNFANATSFETRGTLDDAQQKVVFIRNSLNVGINASVPAQALHIGNLGSGRNAIIRAETGGPAGFRSWDFGVGYADFGFIVNDATGGVRRLTISYVDGRTTLNGGLSVTGGSSVLNGATTITGVTSINGVTTIAKAGGGTVLTINNANNTGGDGSQVSYNGTRFNVFTRVAQSTGAFEFVNSAYTAMMMQITQAGAVFNNTGTYGIFSDERLKENIGDARDYTDDLMRLRVVDYSLKAEERDRADRIGFIAQEVQDVLPELVVNTGTYDGVKDALAVSTSNMTPMLVSALQSMVRRLEALENA